MNKQRKYRILADVNGSFFVEERVGADWMEAHRCTAKNAQGYTEARLWIDSQDEEGGEQ